jgi:hypothetical protein
MLYQILSKFSKLLNQAEWAQRSPKHIDTLWNMELIGWILIKWRGEMESPGREKALFSLKKIGDDEDTCFEVKGGEGESLCWVGALLVLGEPR